MKVDRASSTSPELPPRWPLKYECQWLEREPLRGVVFLLGFPFQIDCLPLLLRMVHRAIWLSADLADFAFLTAFGHGGVGSVFAGLVFDFGFSARISVYLLRGSVRLPID